MASAIGIRVYEISVSIKGSKQKLDNGGVPARDFISEYLKEHSTSMQNAELERSWYFELREDDGHGNCRGYIRYGTFGFESNFVDAKTKKQNYRRKISDVEEIPLFFEFWFPQSETFGYVVFQSFQGRSCINLVITNLKSAFEARYPRTVLQCKKLIPSGSDGFFSSAPVKQFRLINRDVPADLADRYFSNPEPDAVKLEVKISAHRTKSLGNFGALIKTLRPEKGVLKYGGISFPEAVAEVKVGRKTRTIGVLGLNSDAGVIDVTSDVMRWSRRTSNI